MVVGPVDPFVREVLESIPDAVTISAAVRDGDGSAVDLRLRYMNAAARSRQPEPDAAVGGLCSELWPDMVVNGALAASLETLASGVTSGGEFEWTDAGTFSPGSYEYRAVRLGGDTVLWMLRDATERVRRIRSLGESEALFRAAFDRSPAGMCLVDPGGNVLAANAGLARLLDRPAGALTGLAFEALVAEADAGRWRALCADVSSGHESPTADLRLTAAGAREVDARVSPALVVDGDGRPLYSVVHVEDLTDRRRAQEQLALAATHDSLTGLPNRALLIDRLELAMAHRRRRFTLLLVDLDHFKVINDTLGHLVGDEVLRESARRLLRAVRPADTVARMGGDEFVVLCHDTSPGDVETLCERIAARLSAPMTLDGHVTAVGASIGVAFASEVENGVALLRDADTAMYAAKRGGRSCFAVFDAGMRAQVLARLDVESGLRGGLSRGEFHPHFQPIYDLRSRRAVAVEALVRWERADGVVIGPEAFLDVAQQTGLIAALGDDTILAACRQVAAWRGDGYPGLGLSINVSPQQLALTGFGDRLLAVLEDAELPAEAVTLEFAEQTLMLHAGAASAELDTLRALGVRIALDDFGTGFSSLAYLQRLPVDVLKADRTFAAHSTTDGGRLLGSIVQLAEALDLELVIEGVETGRELELLVACGGRLAQGYGLGRPAPASERPPHLDRSLARGESVS